jgi:hypothetical protein
LINQLPKEIKDKLKLQNCLRKAHKLAVLDLSFSGDE